MRGVIGVVYKVRLWWLWVVCSYRFRWAHRPICGRFRSGVVKVGSVYLCRSCLCAYCGILVCGVLLMVLRPPAAKAAVALAGLGASVLGLSGPWCYKKWPRGMRDVLRLAMGAVISLCAYLLVCGELIVALAGGGVLLAFWRVYFRMRRRRRLSACDGCEELSAKGVCSGCRLPADGMRRYEEIATGLYLASGRMPDICRRPQDIWPPEKMDGSFDAKGGRLPSQSERIGTAAPSQ